jgi:hypothetical protein
MAAAGFAEPAEEDFLTFLREERTTGRQTDRERERERDTDRQGDTEG